MLLTDTAIRNAKPNSDKAYKLSDEKGLYLLIHPKGNKWWRFDYRFDGKRKTLALGVYPEITLKQAREKRDEARQNLANKIDPCLKKKIEKIGSTENTLAAIAREFIENNKVSWSESHLLRVQQCFERDVFPWIGSTY